jgi:hypothetical protein
MVEIANTSDIARAPVEPGRPVRTIRDEASRDGEKQQSGSKITQRARRGNHRVANSRIFRQSRQGDREHARLRIGSSVKVRSGCSSSGATTSFEKIESFGQTGPSLAVRAAEAVLGSASRALHVQDVAA